MTQRLIRLCVVALVVSCSLTKDLSATRRGTSFGIEADIFDGVPGLGDIQNLFQRFGSDVRKRLSVCCRRTRYRCGRGVDLCVRHKKEIAIATALIAAGPSAYNAATGSDDAPCEVQGLLKRVLAILWYGDSDDGEDNDVCGLDK